MTAGPHDDPISAASSGLLALGVAPQRRVETLGLLSALLDLADENGEVLLDTSLIETEERLGIDACLEGYEWLERLGVIRRTWSGWMIVNFELHHGPAHMNAAAMSVLARHLEAAQDAPVVVPMRPAPVAEPMVPVAALRTWRRRLPAVAASVAAGVAVLAGATQFVPQAAVTGRNAAVQTEGTTSHSVANTVTSVVAGVTAAPTTHVTEASSPAVPATADVTVATSTTTTLLPCLTDVLNQLGSRTGLLGSKASAVPPGVLPCI